MKDRIDKSEENSHTERSGKIITLCGSVRFKELFDEYNKKLTLGGNVVFSCGCWTQQKGEDKGKEYEEVTPKTKEMLDRIHKRKIELSDSIFVLNKNGYIGKSTHSEIEYARKMGKEVLFLEEVH